MKSNSLIPSRTGLTFVCGLAFTASIVSFHAKADAWDKKTILTVNQTIQVRDAVLEPGQYVLKLYNSPSERHIVQIFNADQSHIISTVMAIPKQRMEPTGDSQFTFWETPAGSARALRAWYYPGDTIGQEFPYPKHLKQLAVMESKATTPAPVPVTQSAEPETATQPSTQPEAETHDQDQDRDRAVEQQPVEIAQNSPPPPSPQAETPAPAPEPQPAPERSLPKTGSPYPLVGLCGGILLALCGLLRLKRWA